MSYLDLIKLGGSAMIITEAVNRLATLSSRRRIAQRRQNTKHLLLGATLGATAGAAAGLLLAPQSGKKTRAQISQRTGETIDTLKERVASTGEMIADRVQERTARLRDAAEVCAEAVKNAATEPDAEVEEKTRKKK